MIDSLYKYDSNRQLDSICYAITDFSDLLMYTLRRDSVCLQQCDQMAFLLFQYLAI